MQTIKASNQHKGNRMRQFFICVIGSIVFFQFLGCGRTDKSKVVAQYAYQDSLVAQDSGKARALGDWVKKGVVCYGIAIVNDKQGKPMKAKEIKAEVIEREPDGVKMRSLETFFQSDAKSCYEYLIMEGEEWYEKEGELFMTKDEAVRYIDRKYPGIKMK